MTAPLDLDALERAAMAATCSPVTTKFLEHTNSQLDDWMREFYTDGEKGDYRLHCLWAWQEQERRHSSAILELIRRLRVAEAEASANLSALKLNSGDMLIVRTSPELFPNKAQFAEFAYGLRGMLPEGVQAMILPDGVSVSAIPESDMRNAGWVRAKALEGAEAALSDMGARATEYAALNDRQAARIAELEMTAARYEKLRKMTARQFAKLYGRDISGEGRFDDLIDAFDLEGE